MNTNQNASIISEQSISVYCDGKLYPPIDKSHQNFEKIKDAIKTGEWDKIPKLIDISEKVRKYISNSSHVVLENGVLKYKGKGLDNSLVTRVFKLMDEGFDIKNLINFIENLYENPSFRAVNELYTFLEHFALPITPDGHFLAYKAVRGSYKDIYSGTFDNSIGNVVEIPRYMVDENKDAHCSHGLHVGAISYVKQYGGLGEAEIQGGNRLLVVKVNPRDAVAVPGDHNCTKLRVCRYEVVGEMKDVRDILSKAVYTSDGKEYQPDRCVDDGQYYDEDVCEDFERDECDCECNKNAEHSLEDLTLDYLKKGNDADYYNGVEAGKLAVENGIAFKQPFVSKKYDRGYKFGYQNL